MLTRAVYGHTLAGGSVDISRLIYLDPIRDATVRRCKDPSIAEEAAVPAQAPEKLKLVPRNTGSQL